MTRGRFWLTVELTLGFRELNRTAKEVEEFPFTDLFTLDHLWVKYSQGKFGFSIQKRIYLACGGTESDVYEESAWNRFGDRVGWRVSGEWLRGDRHLMSDTTPDGYFPIPNFGNPVYPVEFLWWWQLVQDA
jgi:GUN4-like